MAQKIAIRVNVLARGKKHKQRARARIPNPYITILLTHFLSATKAQQTLDTNVANPSIEGKTLARCLSTP